VEAFVAARLDSRPGLLHRPAPPWRQSSAIEILAVTSFQVKRPVTLRASPFKLRQRGVTTDVLDVFKRSM